MYAKTIIVSCKRLDIFNLMLIIIITFLIASIIIVDKFCGDFINYWSKCNLYLYTVYVRGSQRFSTKKINRGSCFRMVKHCLLKIIINRNWLCIQKWINAFHNFFLINFKLLFFSEGQVLYQTVNGSPLRWIVVNAVWRTKLFIRIN